MPARKIVLGQLLEVPDLPGKWSTWSQAPGPGAWHVVPADDAARGAGTSYATVRVQYDKTGKPVVTIV